MKLWIYFNKGNGQFVNQYICEMYSTVENVKHAAHDNTCVDNNNTYTNVCRMVYILNLNHWIWQLFCSNIGQQRTTYNTTAQQQHHITAQHNVIGQIGE